MGKLTRHESALYEPLRCYLEGQGYSVHAEVTNSDLVARRPRTGRDPAGDEELIIVELKRRVSLDLMIQAVRRKELTESVYVAVPLEGSRDRVRNLSGVKALLKRMEVGMLAVRFLRSGSRVEILAHLQPFTARMRPRRRLAILREIDGRYAEFDRAGQPSGDERITAYKQQAILLAALLQRHGELTPAQLRRLGAPARAGVILSRNVYGWFDRVRRGVYTLNRAGREALANYPHVTAVLTERQ